MTDIGTHAAPSFARSGGLYYKHSGRFNASGLILAFAACCAGAVVLGAVYAYCDLYSPFDKLSVLITLAASFANAGLLAYAFKRAKVRNVPIALLTAFVCTLLLIYISWEVWLYAFFQRAEVDFSLFSLFAHPSGSWELIKKINEVGAFKLGSSTPKGWELGAIWAAEFAIFIIIPLVLVWKIITKLPFCEQCQKWCTERPLIALNAGNPAATKSALEQKNFESITKLGKFPGTLGSFFQLSLEGCATCDTTQTLCLSSVTISLNKKGGEVKKTKKIVNRLLLAPEETVAVAMAVAQLNVPAPSSEVPPPAAT